GIGNREQGTGNREQGTRNREQGTGNREQGTGNREQGTGNREQGTGNREQGTGNREKILNLKLCAFARNIINLSFPKYQLKYDRFLQYHQGFSKESYLG
ncbi:hypothetical protein, partial [Dolichospermum flos-aquae]